MTSSSVIDQLRRQPDLRARLEKLSDAELHMLRFDWHSWARPEQQPPSNPWIRWLILAGRGFGKTRIGAESVREWVKSGHQAPNIIAATADDLRDVCVEGESGILAICPKDECPEYLVSKRRLDWPNGARSLLFTAQEPDRLRGKQHTALWMDELASWQYDQDSYDQAQFGLRIGKNPQSVITTTPRPTKLIRQLIADPETVVTRGTTYDNRANLAPSFYSQIIKRYEGTRLGRQELNAEVLDDNPGALFKLSDIEDTRVTKAPPLIRIVVPLDPATTSLDTSDEWGIIPVGMDGRDPAHFYVLEDLSAIYTPDNAAKVGVNAYHRLLADRIVGEANNGGDMIETILRYQDANISYKKVTASRGKVIRAEPVSSLYEQHRVHHIGTLSKLEDELTQWDPSVDATSPNRLDACVWGITELAAGSDGWAGYVKGEAQIAAARGHIPAIATERIDVAGNNHDVCECGSVIWNKIAGKQVCFKCARPRPC